MVLVQLQVDVVTSDGWRAYVKPPQEFTVAPAVGDFITIEGWEPPQIHSISNDGRIVSTSHSAPRRGLGGDLEVTWRKFPRPDLLVAFLEPPAQFAPLVEGPEGDEYDWASFDWESLMVMLIQAGFEDDVAYRA